MKTRITAVTITMLFTALSIICTGASTAPLPGDPVPGVDVSVERSPNGIIVSSTQTNSSGFFEFKNLPPGKYKLIYGHLPGQTASGASARASSNYNTAKSNTAGVAMGTANETWNVSIEIDPNDVRTGTNPGILITIGPKGGKVSGIITVPSRRRPQNSQGVASGRRQYDPLLSAGGPEIQSQSRVKGERDQAIAGMDISLQSTTGTILKAKTDAQGNYSFNDVPPGDWKLYLGSPPPPLGAKASISSSHSNNKTPPQLLTGTTNHYKVNIQVEAEKTVSGPNQGTGITFSGNEPGKISGQVTCVDARTGKGTPGTRCTRFPRPDM